MSFTPRKSFITIGLELTGDCQNADIERALERAKILFMQSDRSKFEVNHDIHSGAKRIGSISVIRQENADQYFETLTRVNGSGDCIECEGTGKVDDHWANDESSVREVECETCGGTGRTNNEDDNALHNRELAASENGGAA